MATTSVKIDIKTVSKVKKQKKISGINVGKFFEMAALEKLARETFPEVKQVKIGDMIYSNGDPK